MGDPRLEDRSARSRALALAVDNSNTTDFATRSPQETRHLRGRCVHRQSVQVQMTLRGNLASAQTPENAFLNARAQPGQFLAGFEFEQIGRGDKAFSQGHLLVGTGESGFRPRWIRAWMNPVGSQTPDRAHALAKEFEILRARAIATTWHAWLLLGPQTLNQGRLSGNAGGGIASPAALQIGIIAARTKSSRAGRTSGLKILLSNDDGYRAEGLRCLRDRLRELGEVTVVAPDRNRSGASNSLTLESPLRAHREGQGVFSVEGTPTDCVHLAITGLLDERPDMVISGVNAGGNLGDDVIYSGTVAAAMEGRFLGFPALAVSLVSERENNFECAARVAETLVRHLFSAPLPRDTILNVNVPDRPWEKLEGFRSTRLGHRHRSEPVIRDRDPRGRQIFWIGAAGPEEDAGPGTDFHAVRAGYVSVTPLQVDLTRHAALESVDDWLGGMSP